MEANDNNRKDLEVMEDNGLDDNGEGILIMVQVVVAVTVEVGRGSDGEQSCGTATAEERRRSQYPHLMHIAPLGLVALIYSRKPS